MLRAVKSEAVSGSVNELKPHRDVRCEAGSPSRSAGGFDTIVVTRPCCQRRRAVQNTYPHEQDTLHRPEVFVGPVFLTERHERRQLDEDHGSMYAYSVYATSV